MAAPLSRVARTAWRARRRSPRASAPIPEETPVAFIYNGSTYAVMMATPADLEDFASASA